MIKIISLIVISMTAILIVSGCVERKLTINTSPPAALVVLNDEEIGISPVTTTFQWYGDYNVIISKQGYETLKTHRKLKAPWYDKFPFDFFAQIVSPKRIVDTYEWTFELPEKEIPDKKELIKSAEEFKNKL